VNSETEIDVAVVGGGPAGVAAAAAAVVSGAKRVLLIESSNRLGGSVTGAMHRCLCGLYSAEPRSPENTLNGGVQHAVIAEMQRLDPDAVLTRPMGLTWVLQFPASAYQSALIKICDKPEIERLMNTRLINVRREKTKITAIQIESIQPPSTEEFEEKQSRIPSPFSGVPEGATLPAPSPHALGPSGLPLKGITDSVQFFPELDSPADKQTYWLNVKAAIDCTGSGALLQMLGEEVMLPPDPQRMLGGFSMRLTGLTGDPEMLRLKVPYVLAQAVAAGQLPTEARFTLLHPGPGMGEAICKLAVNPAQFLAGDMRRRAWEIVEYLKDEVDGFASASIAETSAGALPRDGRRLRGRSIVNEADVLAGRQFAGEAVHAWWPIEKWDTTRGPIYAYPPEGVHYDIPASAVQSSVVENLFAAGLCMSATADAAASLRASGICLATGEMAGRLAKS
jgi:hypothetical protein